MIFTLPTSLWANRIVVVEGPQLRPQAITLRHEWEEAWRPQLNLPSHQPDHFH